MREKSKPVLILYATPTGNRCYWNDNEKVLVASQDTKLNL